MGVNSKKQSHPTDTIIEHAFQTVENGFKKKWLHTSKSAQIHAIYGITEGDLARSYRGKWFARSMNGGVYRHLFHGTRRAYRIGDPGAGLLTRCHRESCNLCGILRKSFTITAARPGGKFGPRIYTTEVSLKADIYVRNHYVRSNLHAMLLCRVAYNRPRFVSVARRFVRTLATTVRQNFSIVEKGQLPPDMNATFALPGEIITRAKSGASGQRLVIETWTGCVFIAATAALLVLVHVGIVRILRLREPLAATSGIGDIDIMNSADDTTARTPRAGAEDGDGPREDMSLLEFTRGLGTASSRDLAKSLRNRRVQRHKS
ncbi:hypothetical protein B0T24DRAFT_690227 [Lasiosphaeria ovina]|uniref:Uncharacterized protein n=1 Tax=Lasiosphaeria ovina TaxID=92902 RepID=A0AAE0JUL9_9PEZI|nr:hypothetical protein B0T24DRAFT_690227 [Lasiosphaeria ovina]